MAHLQFRDFNDGRHFKILSQGWSPSPLSSRIESWTRILKVKVEDERFERRFDRIAEISKSNWVQKNSTIPFRSKLFGKKNPCQFYRLVEFRNKFPPDWSNDCTKSGREFVPLFFFFFRIVEASKRWRCLDRKGKEKGAKRKREGEGGRSAQLRCGAKNRGTWTIESGNSQPRGRHFLLCRPFLRRAVSCIFVQR